MSIEDQPDLALAVEQLRGSGWMVEEWNLVFPVDQPGWKIQAPHWTQWSFVTNEGLLRIAGRIVL